MTILFSLLCCSQAMAWISHSHLFVTRSSKNQWPVTALVGPKQRTTALSYSRGSDAERRRMEFVRSLQDTFYKTNVTPPELDQSNGMIYNLPLWRVPWNELPGRTNVLNVHEPMYTNMFESLLHTNGPWFIGHLYVPETQHNNLKDPTLRLHSWNHTGNLPDQHAAVVGTILRVNDYRRMVDGRLLILVQAIERFVVTDVRQELPYAVAHVQLLPDLEEIEDPTDWVYNRTEAEVRPARALALQESFERWHRYEFENTMLSLPLQPELTTDVIVGSYLAKVLPFAAYSRVCNVERLRAETLMAIPAQEDTLPRQETLERILFDHSVLHYPVVESKYLEMSSDELEYRIWIALNEFLKETKMPISPILLGLLPPLQEWPEDFVLEQNVQAILDQSNFDHKCVRVSPHYPAVRRQKRLSYAAAHLLERPTTVNLFRMFLLQIPSTHERLAFLLQHMETEWGAFQ